MAEATEREYLPDPSGVDRLVAAPGDEIPAGSSAPAPPSVTAGPADYDSTPSFTVVKSSAPPLAANATNPHSIGIAPCAGTIVGVTYIPDATITGAATNNRTVSIVNKGTAGSGTATAATLTFASGTNAAAHDEKVIPLSATESDLVVAEGDVLAFVSAHANTGIADPGGQVIVEIDPS